jgi:hypothetical protein
MLVAMRRLVVLAAAYGCGCLGGTDTGPCAHDSLGCGEGPVFALDEGCELEGELLAGLGQGEREFVALLPGDEPELHATRQGVDYLQLALRIDNPDAAHLLYRVEIDLEALDGNAWQDTEERHAVYDEAVVRYDGTAAEILGIVVVPRSWYGAEERRIHAVVTDSCGREADLFHEIAPEASGSSSTG